MGAAKYADRDKRTCLEVAIAPGGDKEEGEITSLPLPNAFFFFVEWH